MKKSLYINFVYLLLIGALIGFTPACTENTNTDNPEEVEPETPEEEENTLDMPSNTEILAAIATCKPSVTGAPSNLRSLLGASHVNGQYYLTEEPFLVEGARKLNQLGYGLLKLWFYKADGQAHGYKYNSPDWNLTSSMTLKELAEHQYYQEAFDMPFEVFCLNLNEGWPSNSTEDLSEEYARVEQEFYDLTIYLLSTYASRDIKFILSNWEGDWLLRGGETWSTSYVSEDWELRVQNMIDWETARQSGVSRAREDFGEVACKVYNAIEVNKVFDGVDKGIPSVTTHVLPEIEVDMVSWSAYDGKDDNDTGIDMYKGILYLRYYMNPTEYMQGERVAYIGEINQHENKSNRTYDSVSNFCDNMMGAYIAVGVPYVFYWELYGNDVFDGDKDQATVLSVDELTGNWIVRPDGSLGFAGQYFDGLFREIGATGDASGDVTVESYKYDETQW